MSGINQKQDLSARRKKLYEVIFESDTPAGRWFDIILIAVILLSVLTVMLDSIRSVKTQYGSLLFYAEWVFTILFTIEYISRLVSVKRPLAYAKSFFGIVDLLAILPTYISLFIPGGQYLIVIRMLRILRIFRVLKLVKYVGESKVILQALKASRRKITVFIFAVLTLVTILGSLMYLIEGEDNGFTSIPLSIYWAVVTLTTVGYGDLTPQTVLGQMLSVVVMLLGYAIIAVPTGIVTVEMANAVKKRIGIRKCANCSLDDHDADALYCKNCGRIL